jgi:hypothetical protein
MSCLLFGGAQNRIFLKSRFSKCFAEVDGIVRHVFSEKHASVLTDQKDKVNELSLELLTDEHLAYASVRPGGVSSYVFTYDVRMYTYVVTSGTVILQTCLIYFLRALSSMMKIACI